MIVSVFLFPFFFQFSIQYVGGKLYLFVTGIYILPFGWLNSDLKKKSEIVVILVEIWKNISWEQKKSVIIVHTWPSFQNITWQ